MCPKNLLSVGFGSAIALSPLQRLCISGRYGATDNIIVIARHVALVRWHC